jgi:histidinol-phosphate phosphatase family protein
MAKRITIFLDRDGVINEKPKEGDYVKCPEELKLIDGSAEAIRMFNLNDFLVIVVTNQRGLGKGIISYENFKKVMDKMENELRKKGAHVDAYYFSPDVEEGSYNRKPNIGLFLKAKKDFPEIDFKSSFVVGDSWRDIEAGKKIGAITILIGQDNLTNPDHYAKDLKDATRIIFKFMINKDNNDLIRKRT